MQLQLYKLYHLFRQNNDFLRFFYFLKKKSSFVLFLTRYPYYDEAPKHHHAPIPSPQIAIGVEEVTGGYLIEEI
jgi:hypothetical protein